MPAIDEDELPNAWPLPGGVDLRDAVLAAYAGPDRAYHDTRHLREVLARLEELAEAGTPFDPVPVILAAWFHDSVYDGERDAEERSATWAEESLAELVEADTLAEVARLVRLTETHRPEEEDRNGCALSDADLAILAAGPSRYTEYAAAVRCEFAHLDDDLFAQGRAAVLRDLLATDRLFRTDLGRRAWEADARRNAESELARLTGSAAGADDADPPPSAG